MVSLLDSCVTGLFSQETPGRRPGGSRLPRLLTLDSLSPVAKGIRMPGSCTHGDLWEHHISPLTGRVTT